MITAPRRGAEATAAFRPHLARARSATVRFGRRSLSLSLYIYMCMYI